MSQSSTSTIGTSYVVGLLLSYDLLSALLIRKNKPLWQAGKLNGIGGKAEPRAKIECAADAPNPEKWLHDNRYTSPTAKP